MDDSLLIHLEIFHARYI